MWWLSVAPSTSPPPPFSLKLAPAIEKPSLPAAAFLACENEFQFHKKGFRIWCSASEEAAANSLLNPPVLKKRKRYRKEYPGESQGITEEMRFAAMRLRNIKGKYVVKTGTGSNEDLDSQQSESENDSVKVDGGTWEPGVKGFVKYMVDSKLVFSTVERIVDVSDDVSCKFLFGLSSYTTYVVLTFYDNVMFRIDCYFRNTGLERTESLSKDLLWLSNQQHIVIPEPSSPGVNYVKYLEELAERSAPLFLSHFYNIYFSHISGGQVIARQASYSTLICFLWLLISFFTAHNSVNNVKGVWVFFLSFP